ncbi:unnamed protein product, partial [Symbiodinium pilosum]
MDGVKSDLTEGFDMIGRIRPRPGWPARQDGRYQTPTSWTCCGRTTGRTCAKSSPTLCWPSLLRKLAWAECVGRARHRRDGCGDVSLLPTSRLDRLVDPPPGDTFVAASFAIIQEDEAGKVKLRRGCAGPITTPQYRPPTSPLTTWWATMWICQTVRLWGYDLLNAYHQWPVKVPSHSGTILRTVSGPTLSFHHAMCFGAAASVWNFNGAGDALQFLTPTLLFLVGGHYVDDFNGVDATDLADSAFHGFASKSPGEGSSSAWDATAAIQENRLTPETAHRLAGKLNFVNQTVFGKVGGVGGAHLRQQQIRAHSWAPGRTPGHCGTAATGPTPPGAIHRPTGGQLRGVSLDTKQDGCQPMLRWHITTEVPTAGATSSGWATPRGMTPAQCQPGSCGNSTPGEPNIYMLEVLAQILAVVTLADALGEDWVAFIDNAAGQWALNKGYGRDPSVNGLLSAFWSLAAMHSWRPTFHRVTSEANIADPISRADCVIA